MDDAAGGLLVLQEALGHRFSSPELLIEALTHPSAARRRGGPLRGYERLEFLGDRVLGLIIAEMLWHRFPAESEGQLTRRHAHLVRSDALAEVATAIGLEKHLIVAPRDAANELRGNASVLADACEAVIAALYLDGGMTVATQFIESRWEARLGALGGPPRDPKTTLQEWAQGHGLPLPVYRTISAEGPPHRRQFTVSVNVEGLPPTTASGSSKRAAETAAAAAALASLLTRV